MFRILSVATLLLGATAVRADIVHLRTGGRVEGLVTFEARKVVLELERGNIAKFDRADVVGIDFGPTKLEEFEAKRGCISANDVAAHFELGLWAERNGLLGSAREEFETALALDPDNGAIRTKLGYTYFNCKWLRGAELYAARGLIRFNGDWVTPQQAQLAIEAQRLKAEERARAEEYAFKERMAHLQSATVIRSEEIRNQWRPRPYGYTGYGYGGGWGWGQRLPGDFPPNVPGGIQPLPNPSGHPGGSGFSPVPGGSPGGTVGSPAGGTASPPGSRY